MPSRPFGASATCLFELAGWRYLRNAAAFSLSIAALKGQPTPRPFPRLHTAAWLNLSYYSLCERRRKKKPTARKGISMVSQTPTKACVPCRARKTKCDAATTGLPCSGCVSRNCAEKCVIATRKQRRRWVFLFYRYNIRCPEADMEPGLVRSPEVAMLRHQIASTSSLETAA